jgi:hypothetical protein
MTAAKAIARMTKSQAAKQGTEDFVKLLKKFQISKFKFYRGYISAKNREQLALGVLKKFDIPVVKGPARNKDIYNKLQKLIKDLEQKAARGNGATKSYYKNLIRHIKRIKYKVHTPKSGKVLALPAPKSAVEAQREFQTILDELKINKIVYTKKNLSPKHRTQLVNSIIKKEGVVLRGGGHRGRSTKVRLKRTIKVFEERKLNAHSTSEQEYWSEWIKFLKGI